MFEANLFNRICQWECVLKVLGNTDRDFVSASRIQNDDIQITQTKTKVASDLGDTVVRFLSLHIAQLSMNGVVSCSFSV
jgi:hypothetical protein